ncbi:valine--tRNA ligase [Patescibacteria group bacterium]|nr:valine--tRNA ligase [Patescibacteria group bacterium]MBU1673462.1 valine--tRNA ligase [Patescibacteria group bacterium]MBU1962916.1 valine--tRNA ligase [Patescibacteria group bacterium]
MEKELAKAYDASKVEDEIYKEWEDSGFFNPDNLKDAKKPFVISMPPPNATGKLHIGHAMFLTLEDLMIRYHRMKGDKALWIPGTDHAAIASNAKVEAQLKEKGKTKYDFGQEKFIEEVQNYISNSQDTIRNQIRKMGSSCDWSRERFTMDEGLTNAVQTMFVDMHKDDLIYQGFRIVNWCPHCESTLADDEVEHKDQDAQLYYMKYGPFIVATSRPETKLGDTGVAVHPKDDRYKEYVGQVLEVDLAGHKIKVKVFADPEVDQEFGSGVIGVTPAHSQVDYAFADKYGLEMIQVIDQQGNMTKEAGKYAGQSVKEARKNFVKDLEAVGLLDKVEDYSQATSICYRCGAAIEPLMSKQWFVNVNKASKKLGKQSLKEKSIEVVKNGDINIVPDRFNKIYFNWMENLHDWCISRQIWFGHRMPVWYKLDDKEKNSPVVQVESPGKDYIQESDTLDTWFSSSLWTFSTLGWPEKTKDLKEFHPTQVMETGYDILFFWVARMIMMTTYAMGEVPFENVYLHGLVRTRDGSKMSKSKPETIIDPLDMIKDYGTDALRLSLLIGTSPGNDIKLYKEKIASYRNFVNKLWNVSRFIFSTYEKPAGYSDPQPETAIDKAILTLFDDLINKTTKDFDKFQFGQAGDRVYDFVWHEFADWYLEISKFEKTESKPQILYYILENILRLMHPMIPFVTETLWKNLDKKEMLMIAPWPEQGGYDHKEELKTFRKAKEIITDIRNLRAVYQVKPKEIINAKITKEISAEGQQLIANLAKINFTNDISKKGSVSLEYLDLALGEVIDLDQEKARLEKEKKNLENYLTGLEKKIKNIKYLDNAPPNIVEQDKLRLEEKKAEFEELERQLDAI